MERTELELDPLGEDLGDEHISIFYHTSWDTPKLHGSVTGGEWKDYSFKRVSDPLPSLDSIAYRLESVGVLHGCAKSSTSASCRLA